MCYGNDDIGHCKCKNRTLTLKEKGFFLPLVIPKVQLGAEEMQLLRRKRGKERMIFRCARLRPERSTHGGEEWVWYKRVAFVLRIE